MYPELTLPLGAIGAAALGGLAWTLVRRPVPRRLALRQIVRRPSEAALAVAGATLGTAVIVAALVVGDTLAHSVRQGAYRTLGPVDERITYPTAPAAAAGPRLLGPLGRDANVDGVLTGLAARTAGVAGAGRARRADPKVLAWTFDYPAARRFGAAGGPSGLPLDAVRPGQVVVNEPLARSLHVGAGGVLTLYLAGEPRPFTVARVLPERGLAGVGFGESENRNAFLAAGSLPPAASRAVTFVSNRGDVEGGVGRTAAVVHAARRLLDGTPATVDTPKRAVLDAAQQTGDALGALFLMIGSFSIIAAALLLVNVFTMLADERQSQLGMLRAVGMTRAGLVQSFCVEGSAYALAAAVPGIGLGLGVGWVVALVAAQIFRAWSANGGGLAIEFAVTGTSIVNAAALGLLIALGTIVGASVRISRLNVIAAIRDLPAGPDPRRRRARIVGATTGAVVLGLAAVPAIRASNGELSMLLPALAAALCYPALRQLLGGRTAATVLSSGVLVWVLAAPLVRPHMFDSASMAIYVIEGTSVAFAGVTLISQNQEVVVRPLRWLTHRASEAGLSARLALAYPLAKRFRTGATLVMYCLVTLVIALLIEITGVIDHSVDANVRAATAGNALRLDIPAVHAARTLADLRSGPFADSIAGVTPLTEAQAVATDPGHRRADPVHAVVVGVPAGGLQSMTLGDRLPGLRSDAAAWRLVERDGRFVLLDQFFAATGGPNGRYYAPGDTFRVTDPSTGRTATRTIAGILSSALSFYPATADSGSYPIVAGESATREFFGPGAAVSAALVRVSSGVDPVDLGTRLQAHYLSASLVATPIADNTRRMFAANTAFFRLMQGFLGLGLLVGITGLGVVMVRAVHERRRTIGVLRALGFQARTVRRSFLFESAFVAAEGVVLGAVLGVLTTWLMYQKSAAFDGVRSGFPIEWPVITVLCAATLLASTVATVAPARRAARILPALAVRVSG